MQVMTDVHCEGMLCVDNIQIKMSRLPVSTEAASWPELCIRLDIHMRYTFSIKASDSYTDDFDESTTVPQSCSCHGFHMPIPPGTILVSDHKLRALEQCCTRGTAYLVLFEMHLQL